MGMKPWRLGSESRQKEIWQVTYLLKHKHKCDLYVMSKCYLLVGKQACDLCVISKCYLLVETQAQLWLVCYLKMLPTCRNTRTIVTCALSQNDLKENNLYWEFLLHSRCTDRIFQWPLNDIFCQTTSCFQCSKYNKRGKSNTHTKMHGSQGQYVLF